MRWLVHFQRALVAALVLGGGAAHAFEECGELANAYGPYDYRSSRDKLAIVEAAHFTPDVEALRSGSTGQLGGDIDYTLRASPNHPRALIAMANLGRRMNSEQPPGAKYTLACYFDRAVRFADDAADDHADDGQQAGPATEHPGGYWLADRGSPDGAYSYRAARDAAESAAKLYLRTLGRRGVPGWINIRPNGTWAVFDGLAMSA